MPLCNFSPYNSIDFQPPIGFQGTGPVMRIGTKLLMGFIPLAILTAMVAEVLYINSKWISDSSQLVKDIYQNYTNILEIRKHEKNYFFYREKFYLLRIRDLSGRLSEFYSSRIREKDLDEMGRGIQTSRDILNRYQGLIDQILLAGEPAADRANAFRTRSPRAATGTSGRAVDSYRLDPHPGGHPQGPHLLDGLCHSGRPHRGGFGLLPFPAPGKAHPAACPGDQKSFRGRFFPARASSAPATRSGNWPNRSTGWSSLSSRARPV